jgi:hypothetical protein
LKIKKQKPKRKSGGISLMPFVICISVIAILLTVYIGYRAAISERKIFSISLIAIFSGILFESFRISENWKYVVFKFIGTYFLSLIAFLPGKRERIYNFENHIENWPYFFILIYILIFAIVNQEKVTSKLTEGITLMLSISLIYWVIDYGFINIDNIFIKIILIVCLAFSFYSILNALTYIPLSRTIRLVLSVWSSVIIFAFAIDNIIRVFKNENIEDVIYFSDGLYIGIQYFLLGISAVYIMQNYLLIAGFIPNKNGNYKKDLLENKKDHIKRFSDKQVLIKHSIICIVYSYILYFLNYKYQILPRHTMIWLVIITFPVFVKIIEISGIKKTTVKSVKCE